VYIEDKCGIERKNMTTLPYIEKSRKAEISKCSFITLKDKTWNKTINAFVDKVISTEE